MQIAMHRLEVSRFICVAPPVRSYDFSFFSFSPMRGIIIQGSEDEIVNEKDVYGLYNRIRRGRDASVDYHEIKGANHLFENHIPEIREAMRSYIASNVHGAV